MCVLSAGQVCTEYLQQNNQVMLSKTYTLVSLNDYKEIYCTTVDIFVHKSHTVKYVKLMLLLRLSSFVLLSRDVVLFCRFKSYVS